MNSASATAVGAFGIPLGVPAILVAVFAMALTDAIIKQSSADMSLWQVWTLRSALVLPVLLFMARGRVLVKGAGWIALRCLAFLGMYFCMYPALPFIDMALAGAAFYTAPMFIVGLSAVVLGNRVTGWHWLAILTGFAGLLVIVRPFATTFTPVVLMPVGAALCYAVAAIMTKARCGSVAPVVLAFWLNITFLGVALAAIGVLASGIVQPAMDFPFLFGSWRPMEPSEWGIIALLAVLAMAVTIGVAGAYQSSHPEVIAAIEYCYMIFAILWGFLFFGEKPDAWTMAGMALIVGGGIGVLKAETLGVRR